jgi:DNA invertase Pin-like site-specific DNA recombinase
MSTAHDLLQSLVGEATGGGEAPNLTPIRALAWARVSTDKQRERGLSLPEQVKEIYDYAEKNGIEIVEVFEEAASAYQHEERRVEFHRMLERAKTDSGIDAIIVHDLSRFSRDNVRALVLLRELREAGVRVLSVTDPETDPDTIAGTFMEAVTFANHRAYSLSVAMHTRKGLKANGPRPRSRNRLVLHQRRAAALRLPSRHLLPPRAKGPSVGVGPR